MMFTFFKMILTVSFVFMSNVFQDYFWRNVVKYNVFLSTTSGPADRFIVLEPLADFLEHF